MKAAYLGRFQPLHLGHRKVIEDYGDRFEKFTLVIGSSEKARTQENPLKAEEREEIIRECYPDIEIIRKKDHESNEKWSREFEAKIDADVVLTQNELVKRLIQEHTDMEIKEQELYDPEIYSGTEIRRRIRSEEEWRYLVPECARGKIEELEQKIRKSGVQYEFEPGWKKENAFHGTADN